MELVAAGWCTTKWLSFSQTIRNLTSGDLVIALVVIRLGVTGLQKTRSVYLLDLFERRGEKGQCDLAYGAKVIGLMLAYTDVLFTCGDCGFNSSGSWSYFKEWTWNLGTKNCIASGKGDVSCVTLQEFNISKNSYRIVITTLIVCLWLNG